MLFRSLTDQEKQVTPMPGEVGLKDARRMAIHFAAVTKLRLDAANRTKDWTIAEIEAWAAQESERIKHLGKAEPGELASGGDMKKFVESADDEQD